MKKIVISTLELYAQVFFALDKYPLKIWVENTVFAIQHIGNRKSFTEVLSPSVTKLILLHTVVVLHLTHHKKNGMFGHGGGGGGGGTMSKCSKTISYKNLFGTYFVQTCR